MLNIKKKSLKQQEKKLITYKGAPIRLSAYFSTETLQARREWQEIFKVMRSKDLQPRLLYPAKLSFRIEGQIKNFPDKKKLRSSSPPIQNVKGFSLRKRRKKDKKI